MSDNIRQYFQTIHNIQSPDEMRQHIIEQLNAYQEIIEELDDKEIEKIVGGVNPPIKPIGAFGMAFTLFDIATIGKASKSYHQTGQVF